MTDTIEAVARAMALAADDYEGPDLQWQGWSDIAHAAITAHTKALIEGAGEVEKKCAALAVQIDPLLLGGPDARLLNQAAATIAAQKAEIERLTEREAQAKLDGVKAGIEAAAKLDESRQWSVGLRAHEIRALNAEAIAKGEG